MTRLQNGSHFVLMAWKVMFWPLVPGVQPCPSKFLHPHPEMLKLETANFRIWRSLEGALLTSPQKIPADRLGTCVDLSDFMGETQCHKPTTGFYHQNGDDILGIAYGIGFTTWLGLIYWYWLSIGICWWHITPLATDCGFLLISLTPSSIGTNTVLYGGKLWRSHPTLDMAAGKFRTFANIENGYTWFARVLHPLAIFSLEFLLSQSWIIDHHRYIPHHSLLVYFPTCQVRVARFYVSCPASFLLLLLVRRTSTAISWSQWSPPDPNSNCWMKVIPADLDHKESPKTYKIEC